MGTKTLSRKRVYRPLGACKHLFFCRDEEVLVSGPAGTGKSRACLEKLHHMALANPGMRALMVRKTAASLTSSALVTWTRNVVTEALEDGTVVYYGGSSQESPQYKYSNGSVVVMGGMDKATRVMSSEYDVIYVQEATELTENDWEALTTRLRYGRVSFQQLIADCNPDAPTHWLKQRADRGTTLMLESRHEDNPTLFNEDGTMTQSGKSYMKKLDNLTGVRYNRLRKGLWVASEGIIYEEFDPAIHLKDSFEIPDNWDRYWAVDFGYNNPFVCQHWALDPDNNLYLYREFYMTGRTVDQHARDILKVVAPKGNWIEPRPRQIICDHDAEGSAVLKRELQLGTVNAKKTVLEGIQAVQNRLSKQQLFVLRDSLVEVDQALKLDSKPINTLEEFVCYIWDLSTSIKQVKEVPLKKYDHGMDCMRYMVAQLDLKGRPNVRWM